MKKNLSFCDLARVNRPYLEAYQVALSSLVEKGMFHLGEELEAFERDFATFSGTRFAVGMSSGLDALTIALKALGLRAGERVIVPAMTFVATIEAVTRAGGIPQLVDVDASGLMDLSQAEDLLKSGARFLLPVHLYGQMLDPQALHSLQRQYGCVLLEDACQAHGVSRHGIRAGSIGQASAFSFYPSKNLGALGDGGALCTNDEEIDKTARALRNHGQLEKGKHVLEGFTARLDNLQAAFLSPKLKNFAKDQLSRLAAAELYLSKLEGFETQSKSFLKHHNYHLFVVLSSHRPELLDRLKSAGIGYGEHYPQAIHQIDAYRNREWAKGKNFPQAEKYAREGFSIPIFCGITSEEVNFVVETLAHDFQ